MEIKKTLIHWLGGVTKAESTESDGNAWIMGRMSAFIYMVEQMKQLNGTPADKWAKAVWDMANSELEKLEQG